jgi:hypothetical protein
VVDWLLDAQVLEPQVLVGHESTLDQGVHLAFEDDLDLFSDHVEYLLRETILVLL